MADPSGKVLAIKSILILILTAAFHAKVHLQKAVDSYYSIVHCYILYMAMQLGSCTNKTLWLPYS